MEAEEAVDQANAAVREAARRYLVFLAALASQALCPTVDQLLAAQKPGPQPGPQLGVSPLSYPQDGSRMQDGGWTMFGLFRALGACQDALYDVYAPGNTVNPGILRELSAALPGKDVLDGWDALHLGDTYKRVSDCLNLLALDDPAGDPAGDPSVSARIAQLRRTGQTRLTGEAMSRLMHERVPTPSNKLGALYDDVLEFTLLVEGGLMDNRTVDAAFNVAPPLGQTKEVGEAMHDGWALKTFGSGYGGYGDRTKLAVVATQDPGRRVQQCRPFSKLDGASQLQDLLGFCAMLWGLRACEAVHEGCTDAALNFVRPPPAGGVPQRGGRGSRGPRSGGRSSWGPRSAGRSPVSSKRAAADKVHVLGRERVVRRQPGSAAQWVQVRGAPVRLSEARRMEKRAR